MTAGRCPGCAHAAHRDTCPAKSPSTSMLILDPATGAVAGRGCGRSRVPCGCPFGSCHTCGAPVAGCTPLPLSGLEIDVDRGSAGDPSGTLAVRRLPDGTLCCRELGAGEQPGEREWRGRAHAHQLPEAVVWLGLGELAPVEQA